MVQYEKPSSLTVILCILFFLLPLAPSPSSLSQLLLHYIYTKKIQILSSKTWRLKLQLQLRLHFLPGRATPGIPAPRDHDKSTKLLRRWKAVHLSAKCTCEQRWKQLQKRGAPGSCTGTSANGIWPQHYTSQTQLVKSKPCLHRKGVEIPEQQPQKQPGTGRRHLLLCQREAAPQSELSLGPMWLKRCRGQAGRSVHSAACQQSWDTRKPSSVWSAAVGSRVDTPSDEHFRSMTAKGQELTQKVVM